MKKYLPLILVLVTTACLLLFKLWDYYDHPSSHEISGFEYVAQPDGITCGPTSVLMVLKRYGHDHTLDEVKAQTNTKWFHYNGEDIGMTSPDYISVAFRRLGLPAKMKRGDMAMLKHYVSNNRPCIVLLRSSETTWHYVVVIGYDDTKIAVADPGGGYRWEMPVDHFNGAWGFYTDMGGTPTTLKCPICKGTGEWNSWKLGPLSICEACAGSGRQPDYLSGLLKAADVYPNTLIVPSKPVPQVELGADK